MNDRFDLDCATVDEIAAAYGLGAVDAAEGRGVSAHLDGCGRPHDEARELIAAASLVPLSLETIAPSPAERDRLMATIAETPQEHRPVVIRERAPPPAIPIEPSRRWWRIGPLPSAVAAVGLAAVVGLGAWNLLLSRELADREAALRAVATADAAFIAQGEAGSGWVIESSGQAIFIADGLAELAAGQLYEFWLIDAGGNAVAVGTLTETDGVTLVALERTLEGATTFAITVETARVDAPTSDPVLVAALGA